MLIKINEHNNSDIITSITGPMTTFCRTSHLLRARLLAASIYLAVWVPSRSDLDLN
jgi:hypothetical protein